MIDWEKGTEGGRETATRSLRVCTNRITHTQFPFSDRLLPSTVSYLPFPHLLPVSEWTLSSP